MEYFKNMPYSAISTIAQPGPMKYWNTVYPAQYIAALSRSLALPASATFVLLKTCRDNWTIYYTSNIEQLFYLMPSRL